jgi:oligogalacturonide lyase
MIPNGFHFGGARPTGDGKHVVAALSEDLSDRIASNLGAGYIGFKEIFAAKPDCRIIRINLADNTVEEVRRENRWITHVNPSPALGNIITFCHEGPWELVDHRIWALDLNTGKASKFCERREEGEQIGHEYWLADGQRIGYQAHRKDGSYFGFAKYDGTDRIEAKAVRVPGPDHIHSVGMDFIVSDTGKSIKGYKLRHGSFDGPRVLAMHDGSFDWGGHHPHPTVTRDGKYVVYNSTANGYCNIYMTEIPEDFYSLPLLSEIEK